MASRMVGENFKLVGRCHPWCGHRTLLVGKAAESRAWRKEAQDEARDWNLCLGCDLCS